MINQALRVVRAAIHPIGGATRGWDDVEAIEPSVEYAPLTVQVEYA
jgi:hypothetical protein